MCERGIQSSTVGHGEGSHVTQPVIQGLLYTHTHTHTHTHQITPIKTFPSKHTHTDTQSHTHTHTHGSGKPSGRFQMVILVPVFRVRKVLTH